MSNTLSKVYLVRHGETAWTISGQHTGHTDIPLTAHGERDAQALSAQLQGLSFANVLTSPLQRARRTAERPGWRLLKDGCPDGETADIVNVRADRVIGRMRALPDDVLLFAQRDILCVLAARWLGLSAA